MIIFYIEPLKIIKIYIFRYKVILESFLDSFKFKKKIV
jgi:hypothetical protein